MVLVKNHSLLTVHFMSVDHETRRNTMWQAMQPGSIKWLPLATRRPCHMFILTINGICMLEMHEDMCEIAISEN
ncbi:hypothetical protein GGF37_004981, partial [Kickxella alabastrina]